MKSTNGTAQVSVIFSYNFLIDSSGGMSCTTPHAIVKPTAMGKRQLSTSTTNCLGPTDGATSPSRRRKPSGDISAGTIEQTPMSNCENSPTARNIGGSVILSTSASAASGTVRPSLISTASNANANTTCEPIA